MTKNNFIIIVSGPTATGKTESALKLSKKFGGEIINFDSLLFYKELNIGTAKPTKKERESSPHHLVGTHSIFSPLNAASYIKEAVPIIKKCHEENKNVLLVGGSGFYLQALLNGMYPSETTSDEILSKSDALYLQEGILPFRNILKENDTESFELYHENDHYRNRRAVEHFWMTGGKFSTSRSKMKEALKDSPASKFNWNILHIYLDLPKEEHFEYIVHRTQRMFEDGLLEEVQAILDSGATGQEKPLCSIGYKEVIDYIQKNKYPTLKECKERISINTRRLAKSQRTWFNKQEKTCYNPLTDWSEIEETCHQFLTKKENRGS